MYKTTLRFHKTGRCNKITTPPDPAVCSITKMILQMLTLGSTDAVTGSKCVKSFFNIMSKMFYCVSKEESKRYKERTTDVGI